MNCLDVRRLCLAEPSSHDPRLLLHIYHCPACRAYRKRLLAAETDIREAMAVPVPEKLDRQIVFDHSMETPGRNEGFRWRALAATILMSVVLGVVLHGMFSKPDVVPDLARHMMEDPLHMLPEQVDADQRLRMVMRDLGGIWSGEHPVNLTHATLCLVRERPAAHLVLEGEQGPVTVFLIPGIRARSQAGHMQAQVVEVAELHGGSIALFGYEGENLEPLRRMFEQHLDWKDSALAGRYSLRVAQR